jgi:hypothetical protein
MYVCMYACLTAGAVCTSGPARKDEDRDMDGYSGYYHSNEGHAEGRCSSRAGGLAAVARVLLLRVAKLCEVSRQCPTCHLCECIYICMHICAITAHMGLWMAYSHMTDCLLSSIRRISRLFLFLYRGVHIYIHVYICVYTLMHTCQGMSGRSLRKLPLRAHAFRLQRPQVSAYLFTYMRMLVCIRTYVFL